MTMKEFKKYLNNLIRLKEKELSIVYIGHCRNTEKEFEKKRLETCAIVKELKDIRKVINS